MSVLGTIWLKDMPLVDRYGHQADDVKVKIHAATTMGIYVHLSIEYALGNLLILNPEIEAQLNTDDALELGTALVKWATHEKERIASDELLERKVIEQ